MRLSPSFCVLAALAVTGCGQSARTPAGGTPSQGAGDAVNAIGEFQDFYLEYTRNPTAGDTHYAGKVVEGVLRVDAVDAGKDNHVLRQYTALTGDTVQTLRPDPTKGVIAAFDGPAPAAKAGDRLRIRGEVQGYAAGVLSLNRCRVVETLPPADPKDNPLASRPPAGGENKPNSEGGGAQRTNR